MDTDHCPDELIQDLLARMPEGSDVSIFDQALEHFPLDARLHFLRGSVLVGEGRSIEGHSSLSKAVEINPDFDIARFQLGFFELTAGDPAAALATWQLLFKKEPTNFLRVFAEGLRFLIEDKFIDALTTLRRGQELNKENPPMNSDMQLIIDQCEEALSEAQQSSALRAGDIDAPASAVSLLLGQSTTRN